MNTVINFILIAGVIQGFGFNLVTVFVRKKFSKTVIYLNLLVFFLSLNNLQRCLIDIDFFSASFLLKNFQVPWYVLIFPMFYAFTTHYLRIEKRVNDFIRLTFLIFIVEMMIRLCIISYVFNNIPNRDVTLIREYGNLEEIGNLLYCIFLFVSSCTLVFRKNNLLAYILKYDDLKWLKWFIRLGAIVVINWVAAVIMLNVYSIDVYDLLRLSSSILLYWIGYQGFYKYNVVNDRIFLRDTIHTNQVLISANNNNLLKSDTIAFDNEKHANEFLQYKSIIISEKLYLDPLLSLDTLSLQLGISKSHFSKLINTYSGFNFSDFINSLRVKQAKKFLSNTAFKNYTIVAIGLECGFNSKSTFYAAFKKFTAESPSIYRSHF